MESEPKLESKLLLIGMVTFVLLALLFPAGQNIIRQIELSDWENTEGNVTIYEPYNYTFKYNYSVDGIEYTEWRYSFSWDTEPPTSERPYFEEYTGPETKTQLIDTSMEYCVKTLTFTIEPGAYADVRVLSWNDTFATSLANNFPDNSAARVRIELVKAGVTNPTISSFTNEPSNHTNLNITEPGNYLITFSNDRQWWANGGEYWCVGTHKLTVRIHDSPSEWYQRSLAKAGLARDWRETGEYPPGGWAIRATEGASGPLGSGSGDRFRKIYGRTDPKTATPTDNPHSD